jgi:hypothetical protein
MSTASKQDAIKIKLEKNTLNRLNGKKRNKTQAMREKVAASEKCECG